MNTLDNIVCINLDSREDRWSECLKEFKNLKITALEDIIKNARLYVENHANIEKEVSFVPIAGKLKNIIIKQVLFYFLFL
jgi:hypothetical protein